MTALLPQPAACAACGSPFVEPFCDHVRTALAALVADPRQLRTVDDYFAAEVEPLFATQILDEVDVIVAAEDPDTHSKSHNDLGRYCTVFVPWEPTRARTRRRAL